MLLHILTSDEIVARPHFIEVSETLIDTLGARGAFHLRTRHLNGGAYVALTRRLAQRAVSAGTSLIVNDRVDVALAGGAHGVQLGSDSLWASDVLSFTQALATGTSVHSISDLQRASGSQWIMFGHLFDTDSHPGVPGRGLDALKTILDQTSLPVIAVGGITPRHLPTLSKLGVRGVAVISGIWDAEEPRVAVTDYLS